MWSLEIVISQKPFTFNSKSFNIVKLLRSSFLPADMVPKLNLDWSVTFLKTFSDLSDQLRTSPVNKIIISKIFFDLEISLS